LFRKVSPARSNLESKIALLDGSFEIGKRGKKTGSYLKVKKGKNLAVYSLDITIIF
jgi:hypothetical protein